LSPPSGWPIEMHRSYFYPHVSFHLIHLEIIFTPRFPQFWVIAVKTRKIKLRKFACPIPLRLTRSTSRSKMFSMRVNAAFGTDSEVN
jgi:hypothetical protein